MFHEPRMNDREPQRGATKWIDRGIVACLFLFAAFAPHSIAVTQGAWLLGMLLWVARFAFYPHPRTYRTPLDYALLGFFILTGLSAALSYEPLVSVGKLRAATLFTIVYLVAENVPSLALARLLALTLIASSLVNVMYVMGQEVLGRGVKVAGVQAESPLARAMTVPRTTARPLPIATGDTIFEVDGKKINTTEELAAALAAAPKAETAKVRIYRVEWTPTVEVPRGRLLPGTTAEEQLGISGWSRGRDWRAVGFFGHWTTYAESLQLIASLALGLFLACPFKRSRLGWGLLLAVVGLVGALALSVTRASWVALLISAALMLLLSARRRTIVLAAACVIPVGVAGLFFLHETRSVGFFDSKDLSTTWRETVWREGFNLLVSKPRHLLVGVGMDSIKGHWRQWGLFDNGRIPTGHMHSDYLQIALERGVPALIVWLILLGTYARMLWRLQRRVPAENWIERGLVLGALGGLIGFMLSGFVHYNWGDSEVVMLFYLIMGLSLVVERQTCEKDPIVLKASTDQPWI